MSLLLTLSNKKNKKINIRSYSKSISIACMLAVATDVRMYAINNDEVKQTTNISFTADLTTAITTAATIICTATDHTSTITVRSITSLPLLVLLQVARWS